MRVGGPIKSEDDPLDPTPPAALRKTLDAIRYLEDEVNSAGDLGGVSLRYGGFYGPGTTLRRDGAMVEQVRRRRFPIVGKGSGVWSFIHISDVASATVAAVEADVTRTFNVVDDEPAPVAAWLPELARAVGAKPPRRIPAFLVRLVLPEHLYVMTTDIRGGQTVVLSRNSVGNPTSRLGGTDSGEDWVHPARVRVAAYIQEGTYAWISRLLGKT